MIVMVYLNIRETGEGGEWLGPPEKSLLTKFNLIQSEFIILQKIEENFGFFFDVIDDDPDEETMDAILRRGEEDVISGMFTEDTARYSSEIDEYVRINAIYVERGHVKIMSLVLQDRIADFFPFQYLQELTELEQLSILNQRGLFVK
ncbi:MAG: hypothetical protein IH840_09255 [Candidatus Heimdallarchaeota archaeon]|nr:hypothetical protein [Candidatus Heimdallarchaeota archaeon]